MPVKKKKKKRSVIEMCLGLASAVILIHNQVVEYSRV